jgi:YjbE family integral membrane protein
MTSAEFWVGLAEIIGVNIVLSGDNAVVIALAARSLPAKQRRLAIVLGSVGAIVLRVILTAAAAKLLQLPWLRLVGSLLLLWIGVKLVNSDEEHEASGDASSGLGGAIRTILVADFVMSLDNVLGVAAAAHGSIALLIIGLAISIPLIVFGSALILKVMDRFPALVLVGAGLIGYVAGEMLLADPVLAAWVPADNALFMHAVPVLTAVLLVAAGKLLAARERRPAPQHVIDLDGEQPK